MKARQKGKQNAKRKLEARYKEEAGRILEAAAQRLLRYLVERTKS